MRAVFKRYCVFVVAASGLFAVMCGSGNSTPVSPLQKHSLKAQSPAEAQERDRDHAPMPADTTPLPWIRNDYEKARAEAEKRRVPLFAAIHAKWCEPCEKMLQNVLVQERINPLVPRFVWLLLDVDNDADAAAVRRFSTTIRPTYFIVNPFDESVTAEQSGFTPPCALLSFLEKAALKFSKFLSKKTNALDSALVCLRQGRRFADEDRDEEAIDAFECAIRGMDDRIPIKRDTLLFLLQSMIRAEKYADCVSAAMTLPRNARRQTVIIEHGLSCATKLDANTRSRFSAWARPRLLEVIDKTSSTAKIEEKSLAFRLLTDDARAKADTAEEKKWLKRHFHFLKDVPLFASNKEETFRLEKERAQVYLSLNQEDTLASLLEAESMSAPNDYRPFYLAAWTALQTGDLENALISGDRAFQLAPDPFRWETMWLLADIFMKRNEPDKELEVMTTLMEYIQTIPNGLLSADRIHQTKMRFKKVSRIPYEKNLQ